MASLFGLLCLKLTLQILSKSSWFVGIWMVQGCEGEGDIPGIQGGQGGSVGLKLLQWIDTRTQT